MLGLLGREQSAREVGISSSPTCGYAPGSGSVDDTRSWVGVGVKVGFSARLCIQLPSPCQPAKTYRHTSAMSCSTAAASDPLAVSVSWRLSAAIPCPPLCPPHAMHLVSFTLLLWSARFPRRKKIKNKRTGEGWNGPP